MTSRNLLRRVALAHAAFLVATLFALRLAGKPVDGLLLGGGLAGLSFVTFWALAQTLVEPGRKGLAYALGATKILLYFALTAAALSGRVAVDPFGFALGVTCFVVAVVSISLLATPAVAVAEQNGSV